MFMYEIGLGGH